jgi:hypothetical protein
MQIIQVPTHGECLASDVFVRNGLACHWKSDMNTYNALTAKGISIAVGASCRHFIKDGRTYVFYGWESDELGRMALKPKYITALDITDIA